MFMSADVATDNGIFTFWPDGEAGRSEKWVRRRMDGGKVCQVVAAQSLHGIMALVGMKKRKEVA
jgi:hypothetical protein